MKYFWTIYALFLAVCAYLIFAYDDGDMVLLFGENRSEFLNIFFRLFTFVGEGPSYILFVLILLFYEFRAAIITAATGIVVLILAGILKFIFSTPRPIKLLTEQGRIEDFIAIDGLSLYMGDTSFPSGHTAGGFAIMFLVCLLFRKPWIQIVAIISAILVALSRIYLGHHVVMDVTFGSLLGVAIGYGMYLIYLKMTKPPWMLQSVRTYEKQKRA